MLATLSQHADAELLARPDVQDRLRTNADALALAGIRTPAQLQRFTKECQHHDLRCAAFGLGFTNNVGYAVGMTAANETLVSLLPASTLGHPPLTGLIFRLGVGSLDVLCNVVGGKIANDQMFNGSDGNRKLPPSVPDHSQTVLGLLKSLSRAALLNVAKNATRLAEPHALASRNDGLAGLVWANRIDATFLDGGLGFVSNAADAMMALNDGQPYAARLLLREDLDAVIDKKNASAGQAARRGLRSAGDGALNLVTSPTPLIVTATIGAFVSSLFAANNAIDLSLTAAAEARRGSAIPKGLADPSMLVAKRASSTAFFGAMTATLHALSAATEAFVTPRMQAAARAAVDTMAAAGAALPNLAAWSAQRIREEQSQAHAAPGSP